MARNIEKYSKRNRDIAADYTRLYFVDGKRDDVIFPQLAEKYYLQPSTIEKIVLKESKNQTNNEKSPITNLASDNGVM